MRRPAPSRATSEGRAAFRAARRLLAAACVALALWLASAAAWADDAGAPVLKRHVTDLTGTLSAQQLDQLDGRLVELEKRKGAQLVVLMVASTQPQDIESYSLAVAEANKVGRKGPDDGVLLLVAKDDRRVRIEVGYGLEGAIPDAAAARIIREYLAPKFRTGDYAGGLDDAVGALTQLIDGEPLPPPVEGPVHERHGLDLGTALVIAFVIASVLRGLLGRLPMLLRVPLGALAAGGALWLLATLGLAVLGALVGGVAMLIPAGAGRSIGGGGWGGFGGWGGGGGFGGGGGGGGFSGGGGSFGGGGSSGSW